MQKALFENNPILKLSFDFSLFTTNYCEQLETERNFFIARQLLKSGTSIGANCIEAQNAESKADFIHKIKIAAKEADVTQYWRMLCTYAANYTDSTILCHKLEKIQKVLNKILGTAKRKSLISDI
jgi:four helix bundle protein